MVDVISREEFERKMAELDDKLEKIDEKMELVVKRFNLIADSNKKVFELVLDSLKIDSRLHKYYMEKEMERKEPEDPTI